MDEKLQKELEIQTQNSKGPAVAAVCVNDLRQLV